jgi:hypothetical protein
VFLQLPFALGAHLQQIVLLLNTVILIIALIVVEIVYSETPKAKRQHLKYFYPLFLVLAGLLIYAVFKQVKGS